MPRKFSPWAFMSPSTPIHLIVSNVNLSVCKAKRSSYGSHTIGYHILNAREGVLQPTFRNWPRCVKSERKRKSKCNHFISVRHILQIPNCVPYETISAAIVINPPKVVMCNIPLLIYLDEPKVHNHHPLTNSHTATYDPSTHPWHYNNVDSVSYNPFNCTQFNKKTSIYELEESRLWEERTYCTLINARAFYSEEICVWTTSHNQCIKNHT